MVEQVKPACHKEEVRKLIIVQNQHLSCDVPKRHMDKGVQAIYKVETSEVVYK